MFSGKSTELHRRVRRQELAKKRCLILKSARDTRYIEDNLSINITHDKYISILVHLCGLKLLTNFIMF